MSVQVLPPETQAATKRRCVKYAGPRNKAAIKVLISRAIAAGINVEANFDRPGQNAPRETRPASHNQHAVRKRAYEAVQVLGPLHVTELVAILNADFPGIIQSQIWDPITDINHRYAGNMFAQNGNGRLYIEPRHVASDTPVESITEFKGVQVADDVLRVGLGRLGLPGERLVNVPKFDHQSRMYEIVNVRHHPRYPIVTICEDGRIVNFCVNTIRRCCGLGGSESTQPLPGAAIDENEL